MTTLHRHLQGSFIQRVILFAWTDMRSSMSNSACGTNSWYLAAIYMSIPCVFAKQLRVLLSGERLDFLSDLI